MTVPDCLVLTEVEDGPAFVGALFRRRFAQELVRFGHHHVAFHRRGDGTFAPVGYLHVTDCREIGLVGGGCTDDRLLAALADDEQAAIRDSGGVLIHLVRHVFERHRQRFEAFYGVCGNPRAYAVIVEAGFVPTADPQLLVHCPRPLDAARLALLTEKATSFMPF
jgi:hypothetical protein